MRIKYNIDWYKNKIIIENDPNRIISNIFDYQNIIRRRPDTDRNVFGGNYFYGVNYILKRYSGYKGSIYGFIEHAPGLTNLSLHEYKEKGLNSLLVSSKQRKEFISEYTDKYVIDIGPSIAYAESVYDEKKLAATKENLGKTLLVYPSHNIEDTNWKNDTENFIEFVKKLAEKYEYSSVLVSLYFTDIERGLNIRYEKEGWKVVSSGHRDNYDFNDCMKTIIKLADCAVFEGYSSSIGYCVYENVPVVIYPDKENEKIKLSTVNYVSNEIFDLFELFSEYKEELTDEQREFCRHWFGFDSVKSKEQLSNILKLLNDAKKKDKKGIEKLAESKKYQLQK